MANKYDGGIFWLLDVRFDFLLPSFMHEFEIEEQDIILVNSYHCNTRKRWRIKYISSKIENVNLMEPDDINRIFAKELQLDCKNLIISLSGAGIPQSDNLVSLTSTGRIAELCNDKWWQYELFKRCGVKTPDTYKYYSLKAVKKELSFLIGKYKKVVIKRPCLSGGYLMDVLYSETGLIDYCKQIQKSGIDQIFLMSEYIPHQQSFASMGVVQKNGEVFFINIVTEQVLYREVAYEGLIYPPFLDNCYMEEIEKITIKIGKELGQSGYFGYFNVDFILSGSQMYAVEINARLGFGTILAACLYREKIWKVLQGLCKDQVGNIHKRLVIGKIKGKEGRVYSNLKSISNISDWFKKENGFFKTFFCGTDRKELFECGSFIGLFGEFFPLEDVRERVWGKFMEKCLENYG